MEIPSLNPHIRHARAYTDFPIRSLESRCYDCRLFFFREGSGYVDVENESVYIRPLRGIFDEEFNGDKDED